MIDPPGSVQGPDARRGIALLERREEIIRLDEEARHFLEAARRDGHAPLLVTSTRAALTWALRDVLLHSGGRWGMADARNGLFDARTRYRVTAPADLWRVGPPDTAQPRLADNSEMVGGGAETVEALTVECFSDARADSGTVLGRIAQGLMHLCSAVTGAGAGVQEPWEDDVDDESFTEMARRRLDTGSPVFRASPYGGVLSVRASRGRRGIQEYTRGAVIPSEEFIRDWNGHAAEAVQELAGRVPVRLMFVARRCVRRRGDLLVVPAGDSPVARPVGVLVGPRQVRDLGWNADVVHRWAGAGISGQVIGSARVPSIYFDISGGDASLEQVKKAVQEIGGERLSRALTPARRGRAS